MFMKELRSWGLAFLLVGLTVSSASAATVTWTGTNGNLWSDAGNWTGGTPTGNTVSLGGGSNLPIIVDVSDNIRDFQVVGTGSFNIGPGVTLTTSNASRLPNTGTATVNQTGGTFTANQLNMADGGGSSTTYNISGGDLNLNYSTLGMRGNAVVNLSGTGQVTGGGGLYVGSRAAGGKGTVNQTGGGLTSTNDFYLGHNGGSRGTYNLSNGTLQVNGVTRIGTNGQGVLNQTGGTATFGRSVFLADGGNNSTYNLSGGTATINATGWGLTVGMRGTGNVNVSGTGSLTVNSGPMYLGGAAPGTSGTGIVNQTGGSVVASQDLILANQTGSTGTYNLVAGELQAKRIVQGPGTAAFNMYGGSLDARYISADFTQNGGQISPGGDGSIGQTFVYDRGPNLAIGQAASQSTDYNSTFVAGRAVDGNYGNFSHTALDDSAPSWQVDLGSSQSVHEMAIYNRYTDGNRLVTDGGFRAELIDTDGSTVVWSQDFVGASYVHPMSIDVPAVEGQTVRFSKLAPMPSDGNRTFNLAEVEVRGLGTGRDLTMAPSIENLAVFGTASQSTDYNATFVAGLAIDGNYGNFSHTNSNDVAPWWQVDLGSMQPIEDVNVFARSGYSARLVGAGGFRVEVLDSDGSTVVWTDDYVGQTYVDPFPIDLTGQDVEGQFVRLSKLAPLGSAGDKTFNLAEVDVMANLIPMLSIDLDAATDTADKLDVGGTLTLAGTLDITLIDGTPTVGQAFDILDWGTLVGQFDTINLPEVPGMWWDTSQLYITGVIRAVPEPSSLLLMALASVGLVLLGRRRKQYPAAH